VSARLSGGYRDRPRSMKGVGMPRSDAPHLTVAVYPDPGDDRTVEDLRELLLERGARLDDFGYFIERRRRMLVQRVPHSEGRDSRPVEIVMSAGPHGDPGYSRREIVAFARYLTGLLVGVVERTRPLYGGIGVEQIFPTPVDLRNGVSTQGFVSDPLFVRRDLLARSGLGAVLAGEYRRAVEGPIGTLFASWWPFVDGRGRDGDGALDLGAWRGGRVLGRVAARYILERERAARYGE
jgi:hypothetical protein